MQNSLLFEQTAIAGIGKAIITEDLRGGAALDGLGDIRLWPSVAVVFSIKFVVDSIQNPPTLSQVFYTAQALFKIVGDNFSQ